MRSRPGTGRRSRAPESAERIDVAAVIAKALNRAPVEALAEPVPVAAPAVATLVTDAAPEPVAVAAPEPQPLPEAPLLLEPPQPPTPEPVAEAVIEPVIATLAAEPAPEPVAVADPEPQPLPEAALLLEPPQPPTLEPVIEPQTLPEPAAVADVAPADPGLVIGIPTQEPTDGDPLATVLVAFGKSVSYDVATSGIPWEQVVVELPPGEPVVTTLGAGPARNAFRASLHSRGLIEQFRCLLEELDPATGYDVLVRRKEVVLCRWPQRAWEVDESQPAQTPPTPQPAASGQRRGSRFGRRRRRDRG